MKCLRSLEGILNFTVSNSSADFAALSTSDSLFPCIPIWLGIQQKLIGTHNNNCSIYPRCMDNQYSYYEETVNRKVNLKIVKCVYLDIFSLFFGWKYTRLIWESSRKRFFLNYCSGSHFIFVYWTISVNLNSSVFRAFEFSQFLFENNRIWILIKTYPFRVLVASREDPISE